MNLELASSEIEVYISANWVQTPFSYEGIPHRNLLDPNQPLLEDGTEPYVIFDIIQDSSNAVTVPANCVRHQGFLSAAIYTKQDTGSREGVRLKDALNELFQYRTVAGAIRFKGFLGDGRFEAPGWTIFSCQWPFEVDDSI